MQKPRKVPLRVEPKSYFGKRSRALSSPSFIKMISAKNQHAHLCPLPSKLIHAPWRDKDTCKQHLIYYIPAALERTYLSWMGMAVTLGGVSSALVGFGGNSTEQGKLISQTTIDIITCIYAPLSILIMCYALFTYEWRAWFLRKKQVSLPAIIWH